MRGLTILMFLTRSMYGLPAITADTASNYCPDEATNRKWAQYARENEDSDVWQRLFALRVGPCTMVEHDKPSVRRAARICERARR